ncbi:branched-chain-amino-acid transaminase [Martiniozyma asiatica (nom. inval.)]|nr:branched-chain-amino-acid transaminase [Martiniozyma asiatica]
MLSRFAFSLASKRMSSTVAGLDATKLKITKTATPKTRLPNEELVFGQTFTDHMLCIPHNKKTGWGVPEIKPYGPLTLDPSSCVFHYAFELFEGLKAYKDAQGNVRMFRVDKNMARMNKSAERICLPTFDSEELTKLIGELLKVDNRFIPSEKGYSLYLRPTLIGTSAGLGVHTPEESLLFVICSPVGPYYKTGFKAVRLEATDYATRAWPGGVGDKKLGANYAPCVKPQLEAAERGYQQNLWLFGPEKNVTEVGTMNFFCVLRDAATGKKELVTAPLDGTILEGVTRDSILSLARERLSADEWIISERYCTINEIAEKAEKGDLLEAFGSGTAAVVSPIKEIGYAGKDIAVPLLPGEQSGALTKQVAQWIQELQYGDVESEWSRVIKIDA